MKQHGNQNSVNIKKLYKKEFLDLDRRIKSKIPKLSLQNSTTLCPRLISPWLQENHHKL